MNRLFWGVAFLVAALIAGGFLLVSLLNLSVLGSVTHPRILTEFGLFFGFLITAFSLLLR